MAGEWNPYLAANGWVILGDDGRPLLVTQSDDHGDEIVATVQEHNRIVRELRERLEALESALRHIDHHGCQNYTRGRCLDYSSRSKDAKYSAEAWCDACVAAEALWASQEGTSDG